MGINIKLPYIQDMRQGLGLRRTNESKDSEIEAMDPIQRTELIAIRNLKNINFTKDPSLAEEFKTWFESQGIIFVDKAQYVNMNIFLKKVENFVPEDPAQANRYMVMVGVLQEIFGE